MDHSPKQSDRPGAALSARRRFRSRNDTSTSSDGGIFGEKDGHSYPDGGLSCRARPSISRALDDCVTAYRWLLKQGLSAQNIVVAGDPAGGNLTITSLMKLRDNGDPLPAAAACLSPVADLTDRDNLEKEFKDPLLPPKATKFYTASYVGYNDARDPLISPVFGNWHGLPPCWCMREKTRFCAMMRFGSQVWQNPRALMCGWRFTRACGTYGN